MPEVEVEADAGMEAFLKDFSTGKFIPAVMKAAKRRWLTWMGSAIYEEVKKGFAQVEQFGFPEISQKWRETKSAHGWDDRVWHATGTMADSVQKLVTANVATVGWDDSSHPIEGTPLSTIAAALEYGVMEMGIPERPLVRRCIAVVMERAHAEFARILSEETKKRAKGRS